MSFRKKIILIILLLAIPLGGWYIWTRTHPGSSLAAGSTDDSECIVKRKTLTETLTLAGSIAVNESATVRFQSSGKLTWVGVKVGDIVKKNQILARLDTRELQKTLKDKLLSYQTNRWTWEQTMQDNNVTTGNIYDRPLTDALKRTLEKAQFSLDSTVLDVEIQAIAIEYATLTTPITGIVTSVKTPLAGVNITPAQAEFTIVNPESIYFSLLPDQTEVTKLVLGETVSITLDSFSDEKLTGLVTNIAFEPESGETNIVYEAKVSLSGITNDTLKYRNGMTGDAVFIVKEKPNTLSLPTSCIKTEGTSTFVTKNVKDKKVKTPITVGPEYDSDTEILSGLDEGDVVYD